MADADARRADHGHAERPRPGARNLTLTEGLVLCLVGEGPTYGLVLAGLLAPDGSLGRIWAVPKAMVYYTLQQLELLGLITMTGEHRTGPGRARSFCAITPAGAAMAQAWLSTPVDHVRDVRSELMVKLALHDRAGSDAGPLVRAQLAQLVPVAAALDDQLRTATGFERTLVLWRHQAMTATVRFLATWSGPSRARPAPSGRRRSGRAS
jgi:DNA-binding PadR family transcriptional regulator